MAEKYPGEVVVSNRQRAGVPAWFARHPPERDATRPAAILVREHPPEYPRTPASGPAATREPPMNSDEPATTPDGYTAVNYEHTPNFVPLLEELGVSLLVTTYQAGKLFTV